MAKGIKGERIKAIKRDSEKSIIVYLNNGSKWEPNSTNREGGEWICAYWHYVIPHIEPTDDERLVSQNTCRMEDEYLPARP